MYVREYMTTKVITVDPDTLVVDAQKIMRDNKIRRLPVLGKNGKLAGLITQDRLRDVAPSPATSLSRWELEYLLAKMKVRDVMVAKVITVLPNTSVEEAARIGQENKIGTLPVVEDGKLVGILTTTDLFNIFTTALGLGKPGTRLHLHNCARSSPMLTQIIESIAQRKIGIRAMFSVTPPGHGEEDTIIHVDQEDVEGLINDIRMKGCQVEIRTRQ